jgi:hypothetical protein
MQPITQCALKRLGNETVIAVTPRTLSFSDLSAPRKALVRLCQWINYGSIEGLEIRDADPVLRPPPIVLIDIKLDNDEGPRTEVELMDFVLRDEVRRLIENLDQLKDGTIARLEMRAGIPRRVVLKYRPTEIADHESRGAQ